MANLIHSFFLLWHEFGFWNLWRKINPKMKPDLSKANLFQAGLSQANLSGANLSEASLFQAYLFRANLSGANLIKALLYRADLRGANLTRADFSGADLTNANLLGANLTGANLSGANLCRIQALNTNFSNAVLTGACIQDWHINSATQLDNVICDYVYLQYPDQERRPHSGNFAPSEFTKRYRKILETLEVFFNNSIDWQTFYNSFVKLKSETNDTELSIQAIEKKPDGAFVIRVNVSPDANKTEIEKYLKREYELQLKAIDEKYRYYLKAKDEQIAIYRQRSADMMEIVKIMASKPINIKAIAIAESESMSEVSKYNMSNAKNVSFIDTNNWGSQNVTYNNYEAAEKKNLAEALQEIQQIIQQLEQTYPTNTLVEQATVAEKAIEQIQNNPTLRQRILAALKTFTIEAFKEATDNPVINIMLPTLESWQKGE